jgi:tetratricopeptide (TPR) repeat protein
MRLAWAALPLLLVLSRVEAFEEFDRLWNYSKPAETEKTFRELLEKSKESKDPRDPEDLSWLLQLKTQIARTLGLQRKYEEAHALLDQIERELTPELKRARVRYLLERGRTLNSSGKPEKARPLFEEAFELARKSKEDFHAVDAAHMVAIAAKPEEKRAWNLKAMEVAERSEDRNAKGWLGTLYNNMGWDYHDQGEYEKALELHRKCLKWHEERKTGREWKKLGEPDGYVNEEVAECLLALGKADEANPYFAIAYDILSKDPWHVEKEPDRIARLKRLSGK